MIREQFADFEPRGRCSVIGSLTGGGGVSSSPTGGTSQSGDATTGSSVNTVSLIPPSPNANVGEILRTALGPATNGGLIESLPTRFAGDPRGSSQGSFDFTGAVPGGNVGLFLLIGGLGVGAVVLGRRFL